MDYNKLAAELVGNLRALSRAGPQRAIDDVLHGEAFILIYIQNRDGDVLPGEISAIMDVSSARVAAALNSMEKKGLITRRIDDNDRRKILVGITEKGREQAEKYQATVTGIAANVLELLGENDAKEYIRITGRLVNMAIQHNELHLLR